MILLINQEGKENKICKNRYCVVGGFLCFDLNKDIEILDKLIIRESSKKNSFYDDLNRWLRNPNFKSFEVVAYFAARLMYSLNNYAIQHKMYYNLDKIEVYRGMRIPYSDILAYVRAEGKIIVLSSFFAASSRYPEIKFANEKSLSEKNKKFTAFFVIKNNFKKNWISNSINIANESKYTKEKEILYQPFSFYYVRNVLINLNNYKADIYLETIGKKEILEEKIRIGKEIKYNEQENIMEVK